MYFLQEFPIRDSDLQSQKKNKEVNSVTFLPTVGIFQEKLVCKLLKRLVGERGFEPPTPWSRTRFQALLKPVEICCF